MKTYRELIETVETLIDIQVYKGRTTIEDELTSAAAKAALRRSIESLPKWVPRGRIYDPDYMADLRAQIEEHPDVERDFLFGYPVKPSAERDSGVTVRVRLTPDAGDALIERRNDVAWWTRVVKAVPNMKPREDELVVYETRVSPEVASLIRSLNRKQKRLQLSQAMENT